MLYKRSSKAGAPYWTRFTIRKREVRVSCGTASKKLAEEFERRLREQIWRETELGEIRYTWEEAKERWLKEKAHKRSLLRDQQSFDAVDPDLRGAALCDIDGETLVKLAGTLRETRKPGTVNRTLATVRGVLNAAVRWGWITNAPKVEAQHVDKAPPRWITQAQFEALWRDLPDHARQIARFAVAAGARSGNIFRLRWADVDMERGVFRVHAGDFKGNRDVGFPLSADALEVLRQQQGRHREYVFTDHLGRAPVGSIKTCWKKACKRAGVEGFRVHDLRHTFAAWHKLAGTPRDAIKELGGWSDARMVDRYGHINPQDYAHFADNRRTRDGTRENGKRRK
jgi:integrase